MGPNAAPNNYNEIRDREAKGLKLSFSSGWRVVSFFSSSSSQSQIESWPEAKFFQPCADGQLLGIVHIVVDVVDVLVVVGVVVVVVVVVIVNSWALNHSFYAIKMPFSCLLYGCFSTSPHKPLLQGVGKVFGSHVVNSFSFYFYLSTRLTNTFTLINLNLGYFTTHWPTPKLT